jgi:hypothetical protein
MDSVEVVLAMLLAVVASGYVVRMLPFPLPLPLAQIVLGAIIEGVFSHGGTAGAFPRWGCSATGTPSSNWRSGWWSSPCSAPGS